MSDTTWSVHSICLSRGSADGVNARQIASNDELVVGAVVGLVSSADRGNGPQSKIYKLFRGA